MIFVESRRQAGFTLIEMLVIAPIVILAIGAFLTVIISMTGEVLASRASNTLSYDVQDAVNRIEQDVKQSNAFLAENNISPTTPQGADSGTAKFVNVGGSYGSALILSTPVTNGNPSNIATGLVYLADKPNVCGSSSVSNNIPMTMNIVYYVKNDSNGISSLWRRTIMPSDYTTAGCSTPWQQPSCFPGYSASFCATNDIKLVEGVSANSFIVNYFTSAAGTIPDATSINSSASIADRQAALQATTTINIGLSASKVVAGRTLERASSLRASRLDINASSIATLTQSTLSGAPTGVSTTSVSGSQIDVSWYASSGVPTSYTLQYSRKSDFSSPTTISNISATSKSVTGLAGITGYIFRVSATNSFGTTSYSDSVIGYTTGASHSWPSYTKLTGVGDWNKDGKNDIMGYKSNGDVELFLGNGDTTFAGAISMLNIGTTVKSFIGPGTPPGASAPMLWWYDTTGAAYSLKSDGKYGYTGSTISSAAAGAFSGCMDVFASPLQYSNNTTVTVNCRSSALYRWSLNSSGIVSLIGSAGSGWDVYPVDSVFGGGDFGQDGKGDIIALNSSGSFIFYQGDGAGFVTSSSTQGSGWTNNRVTGGWDYSGDGKTDILRYATIPNTLYLYYGLGSGAIGSSVVIN